MGTVIGYIVALRLKVSDYLCLKVQASMVASDMDFHLDI
jgi:hypothetical protein